MIYKNEFYNVEGLSLDQKVSLLTDCKDISYKWWTDQLDCSVSIARQRIDCSFEAMLERLKEDTHIVVIDRGTFGSFGDNKEHFEIGFRTMDSPVDYFLFIEVESGMMPSILEKYNLKPMKD